MPPKEGGFRRGGLEDLTTIVGGGFEGFSCSRFTEISGIGMSLVLVSLVSLVGTLKTTGGVGEGGAGSFGGAGAGTG